MHEFIIRNSIGFLIIGVIAMAVCLITMTKNGSDNKFTTVLFIIGLICWILYGVSL